jgi:hypothetical protein
MYVDCDLLIHPRLSWQGLDELVKSLAVSMSTPLLSVREHPRHHAVARRPEEDFSGEVLF